MIYIQTFFIYDNNPYLDCGGNKIQEDTFIKMAKVSNFLLNQTGKEIHFWGNQKAIDFIKSIGLKYHKYFLIPKEYEIQLEYFKNARSLNKILIPSLQSQNFYMVDFDLFIFNKNLIENPKQKTLYVQHKEWYSNKISKPWSLDMEKRFKKINNNPYYEIYKKIKSKYLEDERELDMYNFGIIGGNSEDLSFIYKFFYKFITENFDESLCGTDVISIEQSFIPLILKEAEFHIKEIYPSEDEGYRTHWDKFTKLSYDLGVCHVLSVGKSNKMHLKELDNFIRSNIDYIRYK